MCWNAHFFKTTLEVRKPGWSIVFSQICFSYFCAVPPPPHPWGLISIKFGLRGKKNLICIYLQPIHWLISLRVLAHLFILEETYDNFGAICNIVKGTLKLQPWCDKVGSPELWKGFKTSVWPSFFQTLCWLCCLSALELCNCYVYHSTPMISVCYQGRRWMYIGYISLLGRRGGKRTRLTRKV